MYGDLVPNVLMGTVRGTTRTNYGEGEQRLALVNGGEAVVVQGLPSKSEVVRLGNTWSCQIATGSAFTNVANMPTTRAELALYNGEPGNGKSYVIDSVWFLSLTSITALSNATIIYQVANAAALTDDANQLINSPLGRVYNGKAKRAVAVTTMTANKWAALAAGTNAATASIGFGVVAEVNGGIIVQPGMTLGVNAVVGTATGTSLMGIAWHEVQLPY